MSVCILLSRVRKSCLENNMIQSAHIASAPNGPAYVFTGAVDGEWTNLKNWEDANGNSPASSFAELADVVIAGLVDTIPDNIGAVVNDLTIHSTGEIRIAITVNGSATVRGIIGVGEKSCGTGSIVMLGENGVGESNVEFFDNGENRGFVDGSVIFNDFSYNRYTGEVSGNAVFNDESYNAGEVHDNATFNEKSSNVGTGTVHDNATFNDKSGNGGTVSGNATWSGSAFSTALDTNFTLGTVVGTVTFSSITPVVFTTDLGVWPYDTSTWIFNTPGPTWIFDGSSSNTSTLAGNATFNSSSTNRGFVDGSAVFNNSSYNWTGEVSGNATFNDESYNAGTGEVHDNATFNGSSYNNGTVHDNATFNDSSYNSGIVSDNATFNESSYNSGEVRGNAAFNNSSYNTCSLGSVTGTVTYNGLTGDVPPNSYVLGECVP